MRTEAEIVRARRAVADAVTTSGVSPDQQLALSGMTVALQWAYGADNTLQKLIDGMPMVLGRTNADVVAAGTCPQMLCAVNACAEFFAADVPTKELYVKAHEATLVAVRELERRLG